MCSNQSCWTNFASDHCLAAHGPTSALLHSDISGPATHLHDHLVVRVDYHWNTCATVSAAGLSFILMAMARLLLCDGVFNAGSLNLLRFRFDIKLDERNCSLFSLFAGLSVNKDTNRGRSLHVKEQQVTKCRLWQPTEHTPCNVSIKKKKLMFD